jgi:hypothetical protein
VLEFADERRIGATVVNRIDRAALARLLRMVGRLEASETHAPISSAPQAQRKSDQPAPPYPTRL